MNYADGKRASIGDCVALGGHAGIVVCSIDDAAYSDAYAEADWAYLGEGVLIEFSGLGVIHYIEPDPDLQFVHRSTER